MSEQATPTKWYVHHASNGVLGPFNMVELAGYLTCGDIDENTPIREGLNGTWILFRNTHQFRLVKELPPSVILHHIDTKMIEKKRDPLFVFKWIYGFILLGIATAYYLITLPFRRGPNRILLLLIKSLYALSGLGHHH